MMTPEEKIAEFTSAIKDLSNLLNATADSAAQALAKKKAADDALATATVKAAASMGNAAKGFVGAMASGEGGAKSLGGFIDAAKGGAGALSGMAQTAVLASKKMGVLGKTLSNLGISLTKGMSDAFLDASKFFLSEVDALGKTFNEFGQIGALGSKGMQGLVDDFRTSGLMMASYKKIVAENTTTFANFKGSVKGGIDEFVKLSHELNDPNGPGAQLRMLGLSLEQVGEAGAAYISLQNKLGRSQGLATADLTRGTIEYAKSMDEVAKLTGINKKTLEKNLEEMVSKNRLSAALELEQDEGRRKAIERTVSMSEMYGKFYQQGISDLIATKGAAVTEAAKAVQQVFPGIEARLNNLGKGTTAEDVMSAMQKSEKTSRAGRLGFEAYRAEGSSTPYGGEGTIVAARAGNRKDVKESMAEIQSGNEALITGQDKLTTSVVKSQIAFEDMYKSIQNEVINKLPFAASAIKTFAETAAETTKTMLNMFGPKAPPVTAGEQIGGTKGTIVDKILGPGNKLPTEDKWSFFGNAAKSAASSAPAPSAPAPSAPAPSAPAAPAVVPKAEPAAPAMGSRSSSGTIRGTPAAPSDLGHPSGPSGPLSVAPKTKDPAEQGIKDAVLAKKTQLENLLGKKLIVTSGLRAGSANHGSGDAIDLGLVANKLSELEKNKLIKSAIDLGFTGIGAEYNAPGGPHIHLDTSHASLVGWGSDYTSSSLGIDSPYAAALINARRSGQQDPGLASAANGGVLSGPRSGYSATLHGTEAVVPLPDGRSIPVSNPDGPMSVEIQAMQLNALTELVSAMKNQVNISSKMLQYAQ